MKTFTFNSDTAEQLMNDLNAGRIVRLTKSNRSAIVLQDGNDIDEFGDHIYCLTIELAGHESVIKGAPVNEEYLNLFLFGEKFSEYKIVEK